MGIYIETGTNKEKAKWLVERGLVTEFTTTPASMDDVPPGRVLICVVENPFFDAAAVVYDQREFEDFSDPSDPRRKTWLAMDKRFAAKLAPKYESMMTNEPT